MVLGGDGTILRAAERFHSFDVPVMGINLGHVGFLAESESADMEETVRRAVARDYDIEQRMSLDITVRVDGEIVHRAWALNEATVEKGPGTQMIELSIGIDDRPVSTFGCDGAILATPTGSTAYAFSAGGPIVWPDVEALLMVPISAHALFAKPLVTGPSSVIAVEHVARHPGDHGRALVRRSGRARPAQRRTHRGLPLRTAAHARAHAARTLLRPPRAEVPAPRGRLEGPGRGDDMISSIGIENLGVITSAHIDLGAGLTAVTGETGAGKTMFVTALDLLTGARADVSTVRRDADRAVVEGVFALPQDGGTAAERIVEAGGDADDEAVLTRILPREGRARATAGGRTVPAGRAPRRGAGAGEHARAVGAAHPPGTGPAAGAARRADRRGRSRCPRRVRGGIRRAPTTLRRAAQTREHPIRARGADGLPAECTRDDRRGPSTEGEDEELAALAARLGAAEELQQAAGRAHDLIMGSRLGRRGERDCARRAGLGVPGTRSGPWTAR